LTVSRSANAYLTDPQYPIEAYQQEKKAAGKAGERHSF
jgi:hypothetical protein